MRNNKALIFLRQWRIVGSLLCALVLVALAALAFVEVFLHGGLRLSLSTARYLVGGTCALAYAGFALWLVWRNWKDFSHLP